MILVVSLTVPANALAWQPLLPADYIADLYYEDSVRYVVYDFEKTPLIQFVGSTTFSGMGSLSAACDPSAPIRFLVYPLQRAESGGPPLRNGMFAIDISDFKFDATFAVTSNLKFEFDFLYTWDTQYIDEPIDISSEWYALCYDDNGNYLGSSNRLQVASPITLQDIDYGFSAVCNVPLSINMELTTIPNDTHYIIPVCSIFVSILEDEPHLLIKNISLTVDDFNITTRTDMLLQYSMSFQAIENQLSDLNDKTDTVINGTPGMQENAGHSSGLAQDQQEVANQVEEIEKEYLDDYTLSSDTLNGRITQFVDGQGFTQLTALLAPIMNWKYSGLIMLLVIAFINMSIIMFGR